MNTTKEHEQLIIAGPCGVESEEIAIATVKEAQALGISTVRMNLWKPRTSPGYEGVGEKGLPWLEHAVDAGMTVAMEVLLPEHVDLLMKHVLLTHPHASLLVWIGSRNQNHLIQRGIGKAVAGESRVQLMIKNQPWSSMAHWIGIAEHVKSGGASVDQLLMCHRGFAPSEKSAMRNIPDWLMAHEVKRETGLPMIIDPSHMGGRQDLVMKTAIEASLEEFDGQIIEVHPDPYNARTDAPQQLDWDQMSELHPLLVAQPKRM